MATLNLSTNGPSISKSYQSVVDASIPEVSPTYAKWAIFSVSTPLMSAFQQDPGNKESVLKVQDTGEGELMELLEEFSEGKIQFAFVKVIDTNTGLPKNVLIAWCGEGVPERTKGYFTSHLSAVSKFLRGYHVQITARSDRDLTAEGIIQKVGDASGAKYSQGTEQANASTLRPPVSSKPVFNPLRTGGPATGATPSLTLPVKVKTSDDDGWGPDAPPVTRTNLEKVQPAYKPTKVNIQELRSMNQPVPNANFGRANENAQDVVRGGYQPIGKVDIAAIRRQAREAGDLKDDRPEPVKGAYEPVGKVDIAAIRARAQKGNEFPGTISGTSSQSDNPPDLPGDSDTPSHPIIPNQSGRLTSLPKPKVSSRFGGVSSFAGTKPPLPIDSVSRTTSVAQVGSASRTFADQGGKTPAQLWAERKAKERGQDAMAAVPLSTTNLSTVENQHSGGGEWKSSYNGKTWAPAQVTYTGRSVASGSDQALDSIANDIAAPDPQTASQSVGGISDHPLHSQPKDSHDENSADTLNLVSLPGPSAQTTELDASPEAQAQEILPSQSQPPRSPTPPSPSEREASTIRVVMPVGRGTEVSHDEYQSPPAAVPAEAPQHGSLHDKDNNDDGQDTGLISDQLTEHTSLRTGGIRAIVQYEYEKAEDNEIDMKEGEYVTEIEMVDNDWWLGLNARGERGLFPSNYVDLVKDDQESLAESDAQLHVAETTTRDPPAESLAPVSSDSKPRAKAIYDYEAAEDNELSFPEGAEIKNIEFPDDDWWFGEYLGRTGLFPANYVHLENQ